MTPASQTDPAAADPLAPLQPIDWEEAGRRMRAAPAFPHFCIDDFLQPDFAADVHDAFPGFDEAQRLGRSFRAVNEKRKIQITEASKFPAPIRRLHEMLASPAFIARMSQLSGIPGLIADPELSGGGIHETDGGGRLDVHVDFNFNERSALFRRLNILLYFNPGWQSAWGGELDLWDADVQHCVGRFAPVFNRAAGFATSSISWHGVTPVHCPPGQVRKSFAAYYYTAEPPPGWDGTKHSTIFRARPDERFRGAVSMPVEKALRASGHSLNGVARKLGKLVRSSRTL